MNERLVFLPYYRREFPVTVSLPDIQEPGQPVKKSTRFTGDFKLQACAQSKAQVANTLPKETSDLTVTFYGPGDVADINPAAIARVEPKPDSNDFEPNYFPFIEFRDPDFLWRYSLDTFDNQRPRPWLALIVLSQTELQKLSEKAPAVNKDNNGRLTLTVSKEYLPEVIAGSWDWATAHVQLNGYIGEINNITAVHEFINNNPDKHCCRLFCLRELQAETAYTLFLVPYYQAVLQEGVGNASLFSATPDTLILPIYYRSSFITNKAGDFEVLAGRIKPITVPVGTGKRIVDISKNFPNEEFANKYLISEGALVAPGFTGSGVQSRTTYEKQIAAQKRTEELITELKKTIKNPPDKPTVSDAEDPIVSLPYYGKNYQPVALPETNTAAIDTAATASWQTELNLDFRNRVAAGLGIKIIQKNQEEYIKQCWYQVGKIRAANTLLRRSEAGLRLSKSLDKRYLQTLNNDRFTLRTACFHKHFATSEIGAAISLRQRLQTSGLSNGLMQASFTRIVHQKIGLKNLKLFDAWQETPVGTKEPQPTPDKKLPNLTKQILNISIPANIQPVYPVQPDVIIIDPILNFSNNFRKKFDIPKVIFTKLERNIKFNDSTKKISEKLDPIIIAPEIDTPLYQPLKALSLDYVLPGLGKFPNNSVTLCEENLRFIKTLLVAANHEICNELLWNRYPIDQRGTLFSYFWDPVCRASDNIEALRCDIKPIHEWQQAKLGDSMQTTPTIITTQVDPNDQNATKSTANLVLIIKADLIRRYPDVEIFAYRCRGMYPGTEFSTIPPIFRAQLGPDVVAIGFPFSLDQMNTDKKGTNPYYYYFVLQEQQRLPRFGLDEAPENPANLAIDSYAKMHWGMPESYLKFGRADYIDSINGIKEVNRIRGITNHEPDAATMAIATLQQPVQLIINAEKLLGEDLCQRT